MWPEVSLRVIDSNEVVQFPDWFVHLYALHTISYDSIARFEEECWNTRNAIF